MEPDNIDKEISKKLRAARLAHGCTQSVLADAAGVTFQQYQKYEKGQNRISASRLYRMCKYLNINPGSLFEDAGFSYPPLPWDTCFTVSEANELLGMLHEIQNVEIERNLLKLIKVILKK